MTLTWVFTLTSEMVFAGEGVVFENSTLKVDGKVAEKFFNDLSDTRLDPKTGLNELRFKRNNSPHPYQVIYQKDGEKIKEFLDLNEDGFFEVVKRRVEGERFVFEELYTFNANELAHHLRRRFYPLGETGLAKRVTEFRANKSAPYKVISNQTVSFFAYASSTGNQCLQKGWIPLEDTDLFPDIQELVERFNLRWPPSKLRLSEIQVPVDIDASCNNSASQYLEQDTNFSSIYSQALSEGLNCLRRLSETSGRDSAINVLYRNSIAALVGQQIYVNPQGPGDMDPENTGFPRRSQPRKPNSPTIICSQRSSNFGDGDGNHREGYASTGRSVTRTTLNCRDGNLNIGHPFISLNFEYLNGQRSVARNQRKRYLKQLLFHEFLHTTGLEHDDFYDPIPSCASYCFGIDQSPNAESICRGEGAGGYELGQLQGTAELRYQDMLHQGVTPSNASGILERSMQTNGVPMDSIPQVMQFLTR